jgi:hypothetical protein
MVIFLVARKNNLHVYVFAFTYSFIQQVLSKRLYEPGIVLGSGHTVIFFCFLFVCFVALRTELKASSLLGKYCAS